MGAAKRRRQALGPAYGTAQAWAWHYTLGRKMPLILRDGCLQDAWMDDNRAVVTMVATHLEAFSEMVSLLQGEAA